MTASDTRLEDLLGLEYTKLGFFKEVQNKISELQASNLELEMKRQEIQAIIDGITDVLAVLSLNYRIKSVNPVFFETFEHARPEGYFCYQVFRGLDAPCSLCPVKTAWENNSVCRQTAIYPVKGVNRQFEITASPLRDFQGQPYGFLLLKRDVTLEKEYQAKYYQAEKMATIGVLAAGVAHEINNPLTSISGFAEGLKRRLPRLGEILQYEDPDLFEDIQEYLETIQSECNRCRDIVQSLLTFSPRRHAEYLPINLNRVISDVFKLLYHQLKHLPSDTIQLALDSNLPQTRGVPAELKQVVLNLVQNALDAIEEQGHVWIRTRTEGSDWLVLSVEDTGFGIAENDQDKLFDPFFTTKPVGKGIGIGLSTCYNIIRQHKGEITVKSEPGKGACFEVRLPLHTD